MHTHKYTQYELLQLFYYIKLYFEFYSLNSWKKWQQYARIRKKRWAAIRNERRRNTKASSFCRLYVLLNIYPSKNADFAARTHFWLSCGAQRAASEHWLCNSNGKTNVYFRKRNKQKAWITNWMLNVDIRDSIQIYLTIKFGVRACWDSRSEPFNKTGKNGFKWT